MKLQCSKCGLKTDSVQRGSIFHERTNYPFGRKSKARTVRTHINCRGIFQKEKIERG